MLVNCWNKSTREYTPRMICVINGLSSPTDENIVVPNESVSRSVAKDSVTQPTVVEEEVGARHLLQYLYCNAQEYSVQHSRSCEHLCEPWFATLKLDLELLLHIIQLFLYNSVTCANAIELCDTGTCGVDLAISEFVSGGLWEEQDSNAEDERPKETQSHRNPPSTLR